jgi:hypothetical protein
MFGGEQSEIAGGGDQFRLQMACRFHKPVRRLCCLPNGRSKLRRLLYLSTVREPRLIIHV